MWRLRALSQYVFGLGALQVFVTEGGVIAVVGVGRLILRPAYRIIAETRSSKLFVATTLLVILGTGWLLSLVGISMVLGAFFAGLLLSETEYRHQVETDIRPFRGIFLGLLFISVGMATDITFIFDELAQIAALVVGLLIGQSIVTPILCRAFRLPLGDSVRIGFLLSQGGEFGFIFFWWPTYWAFCRRKPRKFC